MNTINMVLHMKHGNLVKDLGKRPLGRVCGATPQWFHLLFNSGGDCIGLSYFVLYICVCHSNVLGCKVSVVIA